MIAKLLFAHLVADFLLQPNILIRWKNASKWGVFLHSLVVFFVSALVLSPFLGDGRIWLILLVLALVHFLQDNCKIAFDRRSRHAYVKHFLLDQIGHCLMIVFAGIWLTNLAADRAAYLAASYPWYLNDLFFWVPALLILAVPAWEIFLFQFTRSGNPAGIYHPKLGKMIKRAVLILLLFAGVFALKKFRVIL